MPNRSVTKICRCRECNATHPDGRVFTDQTTYKSHTRATQRANRPSTQQAVDDASRELFLDTLSEGAIAFDSRLGSIRPTESVDEIADQLSDITIKPGRSSSTQHETSAAPLMAERSSSAATRPSLSNSGPAALTSKTSAERPSLQERKRSRSKYTQNQLSLLHYVRTEILHCSASLCPPIWRPLLDQARSTVAVSRQHINHISSDDKAVSQLKEEVTTLLGSLESRWRDLSSTLPDDGPMVYSTGKSGLPLLSFVF